MRREGQHPDGPTDRAQPCLAKARSKHKRTELQQQQKQAFRHSDLPRPGSVLDDLGGGRAGLDGEGAHVHHHARVLPLHAHSGGEAGVHEESVQVFALEVPVCRVVIVCGSRFFNCENIIHRKTSMADAHARETILPGNTSVQQTYL